VAFDTTSRHSNLALIAWVEDFLAVRGVGFTRVPSADDRAKANLIAIVGPSAPGGVVLSGHTDVVPVDGQAWSSDPWTLREAGGRYYGRGTADMKAFLALALAHVDEALAAGLQRPIILAFSHDEEVGCLGAPGLIAALPAAAPAPGCVIVGEPSSMRVLSGHKGVRTFTVEVTGLEAHSSQPDRGASAIMAGLPLMQEIAAMAQEAQTRIDPAMAAFDPPHATLTIGRVEGGTAVNILARRLWFQCDCRTTPGDDPNQYERRLRAAATAVDQRLRAIHPDCGVRVQARSATPALAPETNSEAERLARAITGDNGFAVASFAAEAGLFQAAGLPTVICGPGDIAQAHQPDEWIAHDQLVAGAQFMAGLIARLRQ
jgi:acetylornithine deacetylase